MARLKMILNPIADRSHAAAAGLELQAAVERVVEQASRPGGERYELEWVWTTYYRHAVELARTAAEEGFDTVVAIGGDGTVHEVINGLMQVEASRRPRLGIIPFGSGNDFAHNFGLPMDVTGAARCLLGDTTRRVDVGVIADGSGQREYWDNTVGVGFSGAVNIATRRYKRVRGFMMYLAAVIETIAARPFALHTRVAVDDGAPAEYDVAMIAIANGPREGGGFHVAPGAEMDDGLITYVIMRRMSRAHMARFLPVVLNGQHLKYPRFFEKGEAKTIRIESDQTMAIHADGEVFGPWEADIRELEIGIVPSAIDVLCSC